MDRSDAAGIYPGGIYFLAYPDSMKKSQGYGNWKWRAGLRRLSFEGSLDTVQILLCMALGAVGLDYYLVFNP